MNNLVNLLVIQATPGCNLNCSYCYLPDRRNHSRISSHTLKRLCQVLQNSTEFLPRNLSLTWHAGEPMLLGMGRLRDAVRLMDDMSPVRLSHNIQTNATLVDGSWAAFFKEHNFSIGVSIDGTADVHDACRMNWSGRGSHASVLRGIAELKRAGCSFSTISVVTARFLEDIERQVDFLAALGGTTVCFNFDEIEGPNRESTAYQSRSNLEAFYRHLFQRTTDGVRIREVNRLVPRSPFSDSGNNELYPLSILSIGSQGEVSTFSPELLGNYHDGRDFQYANVHDMLSLGELFSSEKLVSDFANIRRGITKCRASCEYFSMCGGGTASNKLYENGTFDSSATRYCDMRYRIPLSMMSDSSRALSLRESL